MVRKFCLAAGCSPQSDLLQCCPRYCLISFHPILPQHDYGWYLQIHKDAKSHKKYPNAGHPKAPTWHPWHPETPLCPKHLSTFLKNVFMSSWQWSGSPSLWSRETCDPMMIKIIKTDVSSTPKLRLPSVSLGINQSSRAAIRLNPQWIIIIIISTSSKTSLSSSSSSTSQPVPWSLQIKAALTPGQRTPLSNHLEYHCSKDGDFII